MHWCTQIPRDQAGPVILHAEKSMICVKSVKGLAKKWWQLFTQRPPKAS